MAFLFGLLLIHAALLAYSAAIHSPVIDEPGHLAAGISHWRYCDFSRYRVNPPLVRMVAALPLLATSIETDWKQYYPGVMERREMSVGDDMLRANGERVFSYMTMARWACIPFSLVGAIVSYRWAKLLFGKAAGLLTGAFWCFSPTVLNHASLITPDAASAGIGLAACYTFVRWLTSPNWTNSVLAGIALGAAEICKSTWIILFGLYPALWLAFLLLFRPRKRPPGAQLAAVIFLAWTMLISIYGLQNVGAPLGSIKLRSHLFQCLLGKPMSDGEFRIRPALARLPLLLPRDYVLGIDAQCRDLQGPNGSFLRGEWSSDGWLHYYVYGLLVKEPIGALLLGSLAVAWWCGIICRSQWRERISHRRWYFIEVSALMMVVPLVVLIIASAATGMNHHVRYVMPVVPYLYIAASGLFIRRGPWRAARRTVSIALVAFVVTSSLLVFPHSLSYFNEFVGGPLGGIRHLNNSNIDWGQDLLLLRAWKQKHAPNEAINLAYFGRVNPMYAGIDYQLPPLLSAASSLEKRRKTLQELKPGWYAISVTLLQGRRYPLPTPMNNSVMADQDALSYFQELQPVDRVGYSIYIYEVQ